MTHPIILAHGVCRFDFLWQSDNDGRTDSVHYFRGIRTMLEARGFDVVHSNVPWAADVKTRARFLHADVERVLAEGADKVNIIAHSMGGLDARHMLFDNRDDGLDDRVASLTTVSTPHAGSPFADWGLRNLPRLIPIARRLGIDLRALQDLTTDRCRRFNGRTAVQAFEDHLAAGTRLRTFAGWQRAWATFTPLKLPHRIIERHEGDNDGLVSVRSARWRDDAFQQRLDTADHLNELAWWDPSQIFRGETPRELLERIHIFYAGIAQMLP